jgi:hypothetical protein
MGIISDIFSALSMITKKNIKIFIVVFIIIGMLFPLIDSLLIKPIQIEQEISILNRIHDLEGMDLSTEVEKQIKADIDLKVEKYFENNQVSINLKQRYIEDPWKLYSGILFWIIILFILMFQKNLKWYMKIASCFVVLILIVAIGAIGLLLPTMGSPWVNYFMYPLIQIVFLASLLDLKPKKKDN